MEKRILKIGVVGFSRNQFDKQQAFQILKSLFTKLKKKHSNKHIEIVSGLTNSGVPRIAYELADQMNMITVGFSAKQAFRVKCGIYSVQKQIIVGERFGEESEAFVQYIDGLIRVGGGPQSRREVEMFQQLHSGRPMQALLKEFEVDWYGK